MNCGRCNTDPETEYLISIPSMGRVANVSRCWDCLVKEGLWCRAHSSPHYLATAYGNACAQCLAEAGQRLDAYHYYGLIRDAVGAEDLDRFDEELEGFAVSNHMTDASMALFMLQVMAATRECTLEAAILLVKQESYQSLVPHLFPGIFNNLPEFEPRAPDEHWQEIERSPYSGMIKGWCHRLKPGADFDPRQTTVTAWGLPLLGVGQALRAYLTHRCKAVGQELAPDGEMVAASMLCWFGSHGGTRLIVNAIEAAGEEHRESEYIFREALLEKWAQYQQSNALIDLLNPETSDRQRSLFEASQEQSWVAELVLDWLTTFIGFQYAKAIHRLELVSV